MDFRDDADQAAFRSEVRDFLASEPNPVDAGLEPEAGEEDGSLFRRWRERLGKRGWVAPSWPKEYGGAGLSVVQQFILNEEFAEAEVPIVGGSGPTMIGPTLILHGSDWQKEYFLPRILRDEIVWCQGYSEPEAGSDLAGLKTLARRDGDEYVINGQKVWTGNAHRADWMFMLARSAPDAPKHRGISYFLLDMKAPGITVRPLINMADVHSFNEVFFEDVRVPAQNRIGEENRGWYVATTTLDFERSSVGNSVHVRKDTEAFIRFVVEHPDSIALSKQPAARLELADRYLEASVAKLYSLRIATMQAQGMVPNYEASMAKVYLSELKQRLARTAMRLFGMHGQVVRRTPGAPFVPSSRLSTTRRDCSLAENYELVVPATIGGGTSEIQRNIIATRGLGLPR